MAGALGAWRNLAEAAILQDGGMPGSALLLAESSLSALLLGGAGAVAFAVAQSVPRLDAKEDASLENMVRLLSLPIVPPMLVAYLLCAYGKDVGKFWLIKYASALRQRSSRCSSPSARGPSPSRPSTSLQGGATHPH